MLDPGRYYRATSLRGAVELTRYANLAALAGGSFSISGVLRPLETIVDVQNVPELRRQEHTEFGVEFGTALTVQEVVANEYLSLKVRRALTRAVPRHQWACVTLGETLRGRHHPMLREWLAVLLALNACVERLEFDTDLSGWDDFARLSSTGLLDNGFLMTLMIPELRPNQRLEVKYIAPTPDDPALVSAAALINWNEDGTVESARIVVCGASAEPVVLTPSWLNNQLLYLGNIAKIVKDINQQIERDCSRSCLGLEQRHVMVKRCVGQALMAANAR
jgi:CO/xanthine dehydrogenase FAD-binding subunit